MLKNKLRNEVNIISGKVLKVEEHNFTSTQVAASGTTKDIRLTSQVNHHQKQDIWYLNSEGIENSIHLRNCNVATRESHSIVNIIGRKTNKVYRFINCTTGYYWRVHGKQPPQTVLGSIFLSIFQKLIALVLAAILCLPYINFVFLLALLGYFSKDDFSRLKRLGFVYHIVVVLLVLGAYSPYITNFAPNYAPPKEFKIDKDWQINTIIAVANAFSSKPISKEDVMLKFYKINLYHVKPHPKNPNQIIYNSKKDNMYMLISSFLLFFELFFYMSWSMSKETSIQKALDQIALEELQKNNI